MMSLGGPEIQSGPCAVRCDHPWQHSIKNRRQLDHGHWVLYSFAVDSIGGHECQWPSGVRAWKGWVPMRIRSSPAVFCAVMVGSLTAAACASDGFSTIAVTYSRATTVPAMPILLGKDHIEVPQLRWGSGDQLILTTWGSGSCPLLPTAVTVQGAHRIAISLATQYGSDVACTADLTATDSVIVAPPGSTRPVPLSLRSKATRSPCPPDGSCSYL